MINEDYVTFEQASKLKKLRFDWKCYTFYHWDNWCGLSHSGMYENHNMFEKCISAPTFSQVAKWLREKHLLISVRPNNTVNDSGNVEIYYCVDIFDIKDNILKLQYSDAGFENYESALSTGIDEALKLLFKIKTIMEDLVTYEQAEKLAELGFDYETAFYYTIKDKELSETNVIKDYNWKARNNPKRCIAISCPTLSQAQNWLRKEKHLLITIERDKESGKFGWVIYMNDSLWKSDIVCNMNGYNVLLLTALDKALDFLTQK